MRLNKALVVRKLINHARLIERSHSQHSMDTQGSAQNY